MSIEGYTIRLLYAHLIFHWYFLRITPEITLKNSLLNIEIWRFCLIIFWR